MRTRTPLRFILIGLSLLSAALPAAPQTVYIAGGARYTPPVLPLRAATGCTTPPYSFTADTNAGLCSSAANSLRLQTTAGSTTGSALSLGTGSAALIFYDAVGQDSMVRAFDNVADMVADGQVRFKVDGANGFDFGDAGAYDQIRIVPVAKGTTSFAGTFTSDDLTANRSWAMPNASGTVAISGQFTSADGSIVIADLDFTVDNSIFGRYTSGTTGAPATCSVGVTHFETDSLDFYFCGTTNTQVQLAEVAGNTFTGSHDFSGAELLAGSPIRFEGTTNNNTYTTVVVTDPTSARNFTLPNADSVAVQPQTCSGTDKVSAVSALGAITCSTDTGGSFDPSTTFQVYEEFLAAATTGGLIGTHGWYGVASGAGSTYWIATPVTGHPGAILLNSGSGADNSGYLVSLPRQDGDDIPIGNISGNDWDYDAIARLDASSLTDFAFTTGLGLSIDGSQYGCIRVRYDTDESDTTFIFQIGNNLGNGCLESGDASGSTVVASSITPSVDTWYRFRIRHRNSGVGGNETYYFRVNDETEKTFCSSGCDDTLGTEPAGELAMMFGCWARAASTSRICAADYAYINMTGLTRY